MPNVLNRPKFQLDDVVCAIDSFFVDGVAEMIRKGQPLRGDHPAVRKAPQMFIRNGASDEELQAARETVLHSHENAAALAADARFREEQAKREPPPVPPERQLRVKQAFRQGLTRSFAEGQIVDRADKAIAKIVAEYPQYFETPGRPLV